MPRSTRQVPASALRFMDGEASIEFKAGEGEGAPRRFSIHSYTGARMSSMFFGDVVIDYAGVELPKGKNKGRRAVLREHDPMRIVGQGVPMKDETGIHVDGEFSQVTPDGQQAEALSKERFPWQASIFVDRVQAEEVPEGKKARVNGKDEEGPLTVFRKSRYRETSFCALGRDADTSAMAASAGPMETIEFACSEGDEAMAEKDKAPEVPQVPAVPPVDVEKVKAEAFAAGRADGAKAEREKFGAFCSQFEEKFAVEMFRSGKSEGEAKDEHYKRVKEELVRAKTELAAKATAAETAQAGAGREPVATGNRPEPQGNTSFRAAVEKKLSEAKTSGKNLTKYQAMKAVQQECPDLDERS